jgi:hypothetical protein
MVSGRNICVVIILEFRTCQYKALQLHLRMKEFTSVL